MRTLVLVVSLVALALACGASFVVRAEGGASATLEHQCTPKDIPAGVDTVVRCSFTAHNTGDQVLTNLVLSLAGTSAPLPDAYYFIGATRDGVSIADVSSGTLSYGYGDLAPGASSTIELVVIVRSSHPYGAEAILNADNGTTQLATAELGSAAAATAPQITAELIPPTGELAARTRAFWALEVQNNSGEDLRDAQAQVAFEGDVRVMVPGADGRVDMPATTFGFRDVAAHATEDFPIDVLANGCGTYVQSAAIVTGDIGGARVEAGAIAPAGSLGNCPANGQGGGGPAGDLGSSAKGLAFPATGAGAHGDTRLPAPLLVLVVGALVLAAGISVRRTR